MPPRFHIPGLFIQVVDPIAQLARFAFPALRLLSLLLRHQRADFLGRPITLRLQCFNFTQQLPKLFIEL